jgi:hypothetical protein
MGSIGIGELIVLGVIGGVLLAMVAGFVALVWFVTRKKQ